MYICIFLSLNKEPLTTSSMLAVCAHGCLFHSLQSLKEYNLSSYHYKRCHQLQPSFAAALSQHKAAVCEMRILQLLDNHARELDLARSKLDELYRKHEEMQKHQEADSWYPQKRFGEDVYYVHTYVCRYNTYVCMLMKCMVIQASCTYVYSYIHTYMQ